MKVEDVSIEASLLGKAREMAWRANVKMVHDKVRERICFYFPDGRKIHVWFPESGRVNNLHIQDLEEVIQLLESEVCSLKGFEGCLANKDI